MSTPCTHASETDSNICPECGADWSEYFSGNKSTGAISPYQDLEDILYNYTIQYSMWLDFARKGLPPASFDEIRQHVREFVRENKTSLNILLMRYS